MTQAVSITKTVSGGGMNVSPTPASRTCENVSPYEFTLAAGKAGTLSTRSDNNTGELTLNTGHGIQTADVVDIHWVSGGVNYCQRSCTVGTVNVNAVPIDAGIGDNLPTQSTAIVCTKHVPQYLTCYASGLQVLAITVEEATGAHTQGVNLIFKSAVPAEVYQVLTARNALLLSDVAGGESNPFGSTSIASLVATNGSSALDVTLKVLVGQNV